jgi:multiple sugar transport system substrate-binding protein
MCLVAMAALSGCAGNAANESAGSANPAASGNQAPGEKPQEAPSVAKGYTGGQVELLVMDVNAGMFTNPDYFESFFQRPLKEKYPQITLKITNQKLGELIASGNTPDIVLVSNPSFRTLLDLELPDDLTAFAKDNKVDLGKIEPAIKNELDKLGNGKLYGIPFEMNYGAMVYNKDLFDKFNVPYPRDNMTWDDALAAAKKLTKSDGGANYFGMIPPDLRSMFWQYNLPVANAATKKATLTTSDHAKVFTLLKQFYEIPGYVQKGTFKHSVVDEFFKDQTVGMYPGWVNGMLTWFKQAGSYDKFKWDITSFPTFADRPGLGAQTDFHMAVVNKAGKHKDAAYQVLLGILSDEVQMRVSEEGRLSIYSDPKYHEAYAKDSDIYKGKNLQAIFKVKPAPVPPGTIYDDQINKMLNNEVSDNVVKGMDVNTALRQAEEKANTDIAARQ